MTNGHLKAEAERAPETSHMWNTSQAMGNAQNNTASSAKANNPCSYNSTPQYVFTAWCLTKQETRLHEVVLSEAQWQLYYYFKSTTITHI
jgi:hypothetical protein